MGRTKGELCRKARRGTGCDSLQLSPCQVSNVSPTQYEGRCALTCITRALPSVPRSAVFRLAAKPRYPPTRVGPAGLPARESCVGTPESPARPPGTPTEPPAPAWATKSTRDETTGAGRTRNMAAAGAPPAASANPRRVADGRPPPLTEVHISVRPQKEQASHATTKS